MHRSKSALLSQSTRKTLIDAIEDRINNLQDEPIMNVTFLGYMRGTIFGMMATSKILRLIDQKEFEAFAARVNTISAIKMNAINADRNTSEKN